MSEKCPACGETVSTQWYCLYRLSGVTVKTDGCQYSVEGGERSAAHHAGLASLRDGHARMAEAGARRNYQPRRPKTNPE